MSTYPRMSLIWQPRPSPAFPTPAKTITIETAFDDIAGVWHPAKVIGIASRNARCGEFTDTSKLPPVFIGGPPGVPGKDGDCLLLTYRMVNEDLYVRAYAVAAGGVNKAVSNTIYLPETNLSVGLLLFFALVAVIGVATPKRK